MARLYSGVQTNGDIRALPQAILDIYSMDIEHNAQAIMKFEDFAVIKTDLMKTPGESLVFTVYEDIQRGGQLLETKELEERAMSASQRSITVTEWGNAIGVSEKQLQLSQDDTLAEGAFLLGRDYAVTNDIMFRDAIDKTTNVFYAGGRDTRANLHDTDRMSVEEIRTAVETLQTNNAPKYISGGDQFYVCFCHPHQIADIKRDPDWIAANNYHQTRAMFTGEVGRWEDVIFIVTTHMLNGEAAATDPGYLAALHDAATGGTANASVYKSYFLADGAYGKAVALPVEMRQKGLTDYGRRHGLAWYAIMGSGLLMESHAVCCETC